METIFHRKISWHRVGLVMYKYSNHLLPECIAKLILKKLIVSMSIILVDANFSEYLLAQITFTNLSVRIWNALSQKRNYAMFRFYYLSEI